MARLATQRHKKTMNTQSEQYLSECRAALSKEQAKSLEETNQWSHVDKQKTHSDWHTLYQKLTPLMQSHPASSPTIQAVMAEHYEIVSRFFRPSKQAYIGMSLFYDENPDMKAFHNSYHPEMVPFLAQAMSIYAHGNL